MGEYMISLGNQGEFDLIIEGSPSDLKLIDEKEMKEINDKRSKEKKEKK